MAAEKSPSPSIMEEVLETSCLLSAGWREGGVPLAGPLTKEGPARPEPGGTSRLEPAVVKT